MHRTSATLVTLLQDETDQLRVTDAFRGHATVIHTRSFVEVSQLLGSSSNILSVVLSDRTPDITALVKQLRLKRPTIPVVAYTDSSRAGVARIPSLALAGVHQFVLRGVDDARIAIRALIADAGQWCAAENVFRELQLLVPESLHAFAKACVEFPAVAASTGDLASALGLNRKTLFNLCRRERTPPPSEMAAWFRLMLVTYLLANSDRTVDSIAVDTGFPSDTALRNMLKRYVGRRASDLRQKDGVGHVAAMFAQRLRRGAVNRSLPSVPHRRRLHRSVAHRSHPGIGYPGANRVIVALFGGAMNWIGDVPEVVSRGIVVELLEDRQELLSSVRSGRSRYLVLPIDDPAGQPTLPLALHCATDDSNLKVAIIVLPRVSTQRPILEAVRANMRVIIARSFDELRSIVIECILSADEP